jgi:hypothetical protein
MAPLSKSNLQPDENPRGGNGHVAGTSQSGSGTSHAIGKMAAREPVNTGNTWLVGNGSGDLGRSDKPGNSVKTGTIESEVPSKSIPHKIQARHKPKPSVLTPHNGNHPDGVSTQTEQTGHVSGHVTGHVNRQGRSETALLSPLSPPKSLGKPTTDPRGPLGDNGGDSPDSPISNPDSPISGPNSLASGPNSFTSGPNNQQDAHKTPHKRRHGSKSDPSHLGTYELDRSGATPGGKNLDQNLDQQQNATLDFRIGLDIHQEKDKPKPKVQTQPTPKPAPKPKKLDLYTASNSPSDITVAEPYPMDPGLTKLYIGGLFELTDTSYTKTGRSELAAATLALRHINEQNFIPGYYLDMVYNDTMVSC